MSEETKQLETAKEQARPEPLADQPLAHKFQVWAMVKQQRQHN